MVATAHADRTQPHTGNGNGHAHPHAQPHTDFGPIQPLLDDPTVSEVMVNGPNLVYAERAGKVSKTDVKFRDNDHVREIIERIVKPLGRAIHAKSPMVDARLPDGSRVNAVIAPCAVDGPSITIRKFTKGKLSAADLVKFGSMTQSVADFLQACVVSRLNIVIAGGTGSGKTTLLNVLSSFIPDDERIVTIEDAAELKLDPSHASRADRRRRMSRRGSPGHAPGHEHRSRRLAHHPPRQHPARHHQPHRNHGPDGRHRLPHPGHPRADRLGRRADHPAVGDKISLQDIFRLEGDHLQPTGLRPVFMAKLEHAGFAINPQMFTPSAPAKRGTRW
jgi:hypothetical protein